ncbi:IS200/IS605 family element transposase accessory protein TnpB (plasmid) [Pontibacillus sp. ALD_SL1]|uniref:RNA-guided endonuclease InsQ/TnpB family protein n=1 Tax=Pontibacillus sp. ALD_SL1 TaxID=2777185 RepID=UPI001A9588B2|nr:RNA-guided endonuclease TnpB family protein [Pontibacillus sp. ALD_SL1]QST02930.1 IS200/IS605 family element transposase accessory protein TnpB [Pontibacillus sp. ALD_SL1]
MATVTHLIKIKNPTTKKHKEWLYAQQKYASCVNECIPRLLKGETLSSSNVPADLKSAIVNEAIRRAKKAVSDFKTSLAGSVPQFKSKLPISINNQNWDTKQKNGRWYIGFVVDQKKKYVPIEENAITRTYFPYFEPKRMKQKKKVKSKKTGKTTLKDVRVDVNREFRGTIQLLRKNKSWFVAIPIELSSKIKTYSVLPKSYIGVDLGLRHLAVVSELNSKKRQFFSGKEVGYTRRHFRSLRRSLGKRKALRAIKRLGRKENRWMEDYNRKLAKNIVGFAMGFERPVIKMENLYNIRKTCRSMKKSDKTIHSWAFYQLQQFIEERAVKCGVQVVYVDPRHTSQTCFNCGHVEKKNRKKNKFKCKKCNYTCHADLNASRNIASSTSLAV